MKYFLIQNEVSFPLRFFSGMDYKYKKTAYSIPYSNVVLKKAQRGRLVIETEKSSLKAFHKMGGLMLQCQK